MRDGTVQRRRRRAVRAGAAMVVLLSAASLAGMSPRQWSVPDRVFESSAGIEDAALAVDQAGVMHLVWSLDLGTDPRRQQLWAADWDGGAWSAPQAILESFTAEAPSLAIDPYGELHMIWHGVGAQLQYTRARAAIAAEPKAWRDSVAIGDSNNRAQIVADADGRLHAAYPGRDAAGVFYRTSDDGGAAWSRPLRVAPTAAADAAADYVRLAVGDGVVDVVWTEYQLPSASPALGVFHARSTDGGESWSAPARLGSAGDVQANVARLDAATVHVAWNGSAAMPGRFHTWTADGGRTWSPTARVLARGGAAGPPQLAVDSGGTLHLVSTQGDGAWYLAWAGGEWSAPQCISCAGEDAGGPLSESRLTIVGGNRLEAVYRAGSGALWHTWAHIDAPSQEPLPVRTVGWWSPRFWHRDLQHVPVLLAMAASVVAVRVVRRWRARAPRRSA